jgi:branched-chain amino acid transport system ATP-binding protein
VLLEVRDIWVHYEKVAALQGVSLELGEGEIVCLLGANGAGKTTTLRTISGLKRPTKGEVWYQGQRIDSLRSQEIVRRGIAQVPEGRRIFPQMSVMDNLNMGAYLRRDKAEASRDLEGIFEHFPILKERRKQLGGSLSGGEQQMLAAARALMTKPRLLLMDEPTLGLSPIMVEEVAKIVTDINQIGVSIVLVEQNARVALRLAHRAYVLETGRVALSGDSRDLANNDHVQRAYLGG